MNDFQAKHLTISGTVQGVYYRASMKRKADELGVSGWCRNLSDGRVEALVQGTAKGLDGIIAWAYDGPPDARVADVQVADRKVESLRGFEIQ